MRNIEVSVEKWLEENINSISNQLYKNLYHDFHVSVAGLADSSSTWEKLKVEMIESTLHLRAF